MKKFIIKENNYINRDVFAFYNCEYIGYQKKGNPDFINHLKNMSKKYNELDLVNDFIEVYEKAFEDIKKLINNSLNYLVCVIPRSKIEKSYNQSQLLFKKAISCIVDNLGLENGTNIIHRIKNTKTTHDWRLENNTGKTPYKGITLDTCEINKNRIKDKNIILVDDIYTPNVNVAEDCIQTLFDLGAKDVILYVIAKTRG